MDIDDLLTMLRRKLLALAAVQDRLFQEARDKEDSGYLCVVEK
jgi:hypothetical protein